MKKWLKERDINLGIVMIVTGSLLVFIPAEIILSVGLISYGMIQLFWKKEETTIINHHHHNHKDVAKDKRGKKKRITKKKATKR